MKIAISSEAPKVIFNHTQEDETAVLTFTETQQTVFSGVSITINVHGPEDGSRLRGERSTKSSDTRDLEDNRGPADSHKEFMRTHVHMSIDDLDEESMDGYESAERSEAPSATASATSSPTAHIASTAQSSTIM